MGWAGPVGLIGEIINSCTLFVENTQKKKPLCDHGVGREIGSIIKKLFVSVHTG
jgi:hypothetical protein